MKAFIKNHLSLVIRSAIILLLLIFLIVLIILKNNQAICEVWTQGFGRWYLTVFGTVTKWIPFSLSELVIITIAIFTILWIVLFIIDCVKKRRRKAVGCVLNIGLVAIAITTIYFATAELAYNRAQMPITLYEEKVDKSEFNSIVNYFIDDLNYCVNQLDFDENNELISPYSLSETNVKLEEEYSKITDPYFSSFTTYAKPMISSFLYREFHITGVTFMPLAESNVNYLNVAAGKPYTAAHELAHTKGVMREGDADLLTASLLLTSTDPYFRYSAYYYTISSLLTLANYTGTSGDYMAALNRIDNKWYKNMTYNNEYWNSHDTFQKIANWWNDLYLKMSGVKEGVDSYSDTPTEINKQTNEITSFSNYQKLYFQIYYSNAK